MNNVHRNTLTCFLFAVTLCMLFFKIFKCHSQIFPKDELRKLRLEYHHKLLSCLYLAIFSNYLTWYFILINNDDKIISLNRRIKTQFLFNMSNEFFCFSNKLSEITAPLSSYIYIYNNLQ